MYSTRAAKEMLLTKKKSPQVTHDDRFMFVWQPSVTLRFIKVKVKKLTEVCSSSLF